MARRTKSQSLPKEDTRVQEFLDMIAPSVIKFNTDHFICGNTYRCVWALREILCNRYDCLWLFFHLRDGTLGKSGTEVERHVFSDENVPYLICRFYG